MVREGLAILFVLAWLLLFIVDLYDDRITVPFWFHVLGAGVLSYALGVNLAQLVDVRTVVALAEPGRAAIRRWLARRRAE